MQFDSTNIVFIDSRNSYMYNIIYNACMSISYIYISIIVALYYKFKSLLDTFALETVYQSTHSKYNRK